MTTKPTQTTSRYSNQAVIILSSKKIWTDLELTILFLAFLSLAGQAIRFLTVYDEAFGLIPLVNMGKTFSIPTIFTVLLYFMAFVFLGLISGVKIVNKDRFSLHWCGLATTALYLVFDKGTALHTYVFKQIRTWVGSSLPFFPHHRWVFSLAIVLIILVCFYLKFIAALPKETRKYALIAFAIYYTGFLVIERFGDDFAAIYGTNLLGYSILLTLGRTLQMSGVVAAIFALLDYLQLSVPRISLEQ